jgi:hypothetical protein
MHQWHKLSKEAKYTAISRTTSFKFVNVIAVEDQQDEDDLEVTDVSLLQRRIAERRRMKNKFYRKRKESHSILMRIVKNPNASDE